jgi:Flp pilus assembly protein TadG
LAHRFIRFVSSLGRDQRGTIALIFGLMIVPLILAIGVGVDYARAAQFRAQLQGITDSSALAGAAAFVSCASQTTGTTAATNYFNNAKTYLTPNSGFGSGPTVTPGPTSCSSSTTAFTMTVTASTTMPTTLMALYMSSIPITTSSTATNPVVTGNFDTGGFVSYACDTNIVYWYVVPPKGGVPAASAMNELWSNNSATPPSTATFQVTASQKIGFAIQNITGARPTSLGGCNYGNNGYGSQPGDAQWLYSSLTPPTLDYTTGPGGISTGSHATNFPTTENCTLIVEQGTTSHGSTSYPSAPQGNCYSSNGQNENDNTYSGGNMTGVTCCDSTTLTMTTTLTNAAPSCSQLGGNSYQYDWNDNGGNFDSYNYGNDMQYNFSCSGGSSGGSGGNGTTTTGLTLTN